MTYDLLPEEQWRARAGCRGRGIFPGHALVFQLTCSPGGQGVVCPQGWRMVTSNEQSLVVNTNPARMQ